MQDLRIVGVDAEGDQKDSPRLLLSDAEGAEYALPIDEALKTAIAQQAAPPAEDSAKQVQLSPRDIQARLRAGATVDEVIEASGLSRQHVLRYAGPVADERAFYATRARQTQVARASSAEQHKLAFGDSPATLEAMVKVRLRSMGVSLETISWDAWRRENGQWAIICDFDAETSQAQAGGIGQRPPAEWTFDPSSRQVRAENKWAESLSTLPDTATRPRRLGRRLAAVEEPFDVDGPAATPAPAVTSPPAPAPGTNDDDAEGGDHQDLLDILRARRGQRLGADESGDDKLASLLTRDERAAVEPSPGQNAKTSQRRPKRQPANEQTTEELPGLAGHSLKPRQDAEAESTETGEEDQPEYTSREVEEQDSGIDAWGFSYEDSADDLAEPEESEPEPEPQPEDDPAQKKDQPKKKSSSKRPTMPRWDDILFGSKD